MATRIFVGSLGDIAPIAVFAETELETAVGGESSIGFITVKDIGLSRADFIPMSRVTVDRGPGTDPIYSGYLIKPSRRFWFDVDYPETLQRKWVLWCADINLLWSRRVVYKQSDPADITGPKYTTDTFDDDALAELFADWVDLSFDDLDTSSQVDRVGLINYDQTVYPWNGGQTLGEAVRTIAQLPAAVYGINSKREVVYADVDDENAPFVLSDAYIPPQVSVPSIHTSKYATGALENPPVGWTFLRLDDLDMSIDPSDPDELMDWSANGDRGPIWWLKMVLDTTAHLRLSTAGSTLVDTQLFVYKKTGHPTTADEAIAIADDPTRGYTIECRWDNVYAIWPFDETTGTVATDWSEAGGKSGLYRNTPTLNQPGPGTLRSVLFNGTNEFMDVASTTIFGGTSTTELSWECWVKHDGTHGATGDTIFGKGTLSPHVWLTTDGKIALSKADEGVIAQTVNPVITDTNWHHVVVTWWHNFGVEIFIDTVSVPVTTPTWRTFVANSTRFCIASKHPVATDLWHGSLSAPAVYNLLLTQDEIDRHYRQTFQNHAAKPGLPNGSLTYDTYEPGTYWIGIQSVYDFLDPWETRAFLNIYRQAGDTVPEPDAGWEPEGTPGAEVVGYRESTIIHDGTRLANDVMAWGFGMGSPNGVFKRLRDGDSITDHGLWQEAVTLYSVYKQATINKVADSVVNGSPASRRGRKNDKDSIECVIHQDGLHVGDRVRFISHIWRYEDVIPVRKMKLKFPTPDDVRYELILSHEIDEWGFQDPLPPFQIPGPYPINIPPLPPFPPEPPPELPPSCVEAFFSHDSFASRTLFTTGPWTNGAATMWGNPSPNLGSPTSWLNWGLTSTFGDASDLAAVTASGATATLMVSSDEFGVRLPYLVTAPWNRDVITGRFNFQFVDMPAGIELELTYGAVKAILRLTDGEIDVETGSGTSTGAFTDWVEDQYYVAELSLDLVNNEVRVKVQRETGGTEVFELTRAADGERAGDGTYQPFIGIWLRSLTATARIQFKPLRSLMYADATTAEQDIFGGSTSVSGWGLPWLTYLSPSNQTDDPSLIYEADGTIRVLDGSTSTSGYIERPLDGGSLDLAFSISDYSSVPLAQRFNLLILHFDTILPSTLRHRASIGGTIGLSVGTGTGSSLNTSTALFNAGDPVNVRIQFSSGGMRMKVWAGGTAEPSAWTLELPRITTPWPALVLGVMYNAPNNVVGYQVRLGPLDLDTGEEPARLLVGPDDLGAVLFGTNAGAANTRGRFRSWPFTDPGGYAVVFGSDQYTQLQFGVPNATPHYQAGVVWPVFGPDISNGIPYQRFHRISSLAFPIVLFKEEPVDYAIRVKGTLRVHIGEGKREDLGATGILEPVNVTIETFDYGLGASVTPPTHTEYTIETGTDVWNSIYENVQVGSDETKAFEFVADSDHLVDVGDGSKVLQMSVRIDGIDHELFEAVRLAGPLWGGIFLVTPNNGNVSAFFSTISFELVPTSLGYPISPRVDPCLPNPLGYDYSQEQGRICTTWFGDEVDGVVDDFPMPGKFVTGSCDVIVNGETLTPGVDFTETVDNTEVHFTTPPPAGAWVFICCTVT